MERPSLGLVVWTLMVAAAAFFLAVVLGTLGTIAFTHPPPPPVPAAASVVFSAQPINWRFRQVTPDTWLLPMNPADFTQPTSFADSSYFFLLPAPGVLYRVHIAGDALLFGSTNTVLDGNGTALPVSLDLWINGSFAKRLVTIPPAATTFDIVGTPLFSVGLYDRYQYVFDLTNNSGTSFLGAFLVSCSWLPLSR